MSSAALPDVPVAGAAPQERPATTFPALDSLRAVGALAVLTTHTAFWAGVYTASSPWGALASRLDVGVALFFVLSGFLLARPWISRSLDGRRAPGAGRYLWKRFCRIAPLYVVTAALALGLIGANADRSPVQWVLTLLLLDTATDAPDPAGLTHMWSLAVEVSFYLLLPLLMLLLLGRGRWSSGRVAAGLLALVAVTCWWHLDGAGRAGEVSAGVPLQWLPAYLAWFAAGIGLAAVHELWVRGRGGRVAEAAVAVGRQPGACWAVVVGLMLVSATPIAGPVLLTPPTPAESLVKALLYAAVGTLVVVTGVFAPRGGAYARALGHPAARHLGVISFGVFALHVPVMHLVMAVGGWSIFQVGLLQLWLPTLLVSLVVAEVAYRVVERPALRLKSWSPGVRGSRASTSTATSGTSTR